MQRTNLLGFYFTMADPNGQKHRYRLTPEQISREDFSPAEDRKGVVREWEIDRVDLPFYKFSDIISDESFWKLVEAVAK